MHKNFVQRHVILFSIIVFCFVVVPFVREVYAQEKKGEETSIVIRMQEEKEEAPIEKKRVVLDAGHGGYDDGSVAEDGTKEKTITLQLTKKIGKLLEEQQVEVIYTRSSDEVSWPSNNADDLLERSYIANSADADVFVSIHTNYAEEMQDEVQGAEIWVQMEDPQSKQLAENVNKQLLTLDGIQTRGLKAEEDAPLSLLEYNAMPSILVEAGFLSNPSDLAYLTSEESQNALAEVIARGILDTLEK